MSPPPLSDKKTIKMNKNCNINSWRMLHDGRCFTVLLYDESIGFRCYKYILVLPLFVKLSYFPCSLVMKGICLNHFDCDFATPFADSNPPLTNPPHRRPNTTGPSQPRRNPVTVSIFSRARRSLRRVFLLAVMKRKEPTLATTDKVKAFFQKFMVATNY
jgi:hypothetical protein